jgi:hypothetical protein
MKLFRLETPYAMLKDGNELNREGYTWVWFNDLVKISVDICERCHFRTQAPQHRSVDMIPADLAIWAEAFVWPLAKVIWDEKVTELAGKHRRCVRALHLATTTRLTHKTASLSSLDDNELHGKLSFPFEYAVQT